MVSRHRPRIKIADLRKERTNFTQEEFALLLGKSVDTISNYERGKTGTEVIQLIIKMCELLKCQVNELIEYVEDDQLADTVEQVEDSIKVNLYDTLRNWWQRVVPGSRVLGGKEIDGVIDILRSRTNFISDEDISTSFALDGDLEEQIQRIVDEYENEQKTRYDLLDIEDKKQFQWDTLSKDPNRCSCIFAYLKTRNEHFLVNLNSKLKRLSKKYLSSD